MSRNEIDVAPVISVRIVSVDHYSTFPNPHVDHTTTQFSKPVSRGFRVPVIRIFGVTENGQKACVHLHRVYPYFYVPYHGLTDPHQVRLYIHKFGTSLNHAIALGLGRHPDDAAKCLFIASIALVKGIPYYGFHSRYQPFLKISVLNPSMLNRIVSLVENGSVMGESFQPYEAHLPYLHQFFIDYNLYGMDFIHFADARFRLPIYEIPRNEQTSDSATQLFTDASVLDQRKWPSRFKIERQSYCELEIDTWAEDIMNRSLIDERPRKALIDLQNGTLDLGDTKLVPSLANLWEDERERRRMKGISKAMPAGGTITQASNRLPYQPWGNEERLRRELMASMQQAKGVAGADQMDIPFQEQLGVWEDDAFQTAFQSVPAWKSPQETHQVDTEAEIQKTTIEVYGPTELRRASTQLNDQDLMDLNGLVDVELDMERITQAIGFQQQSQSNSDIAEILEWMADSTQTSEPPSSSLTPKEVRVFSPLGDPATDVDESADEGFDDTDEGLANMTLLYDDPLTPASTVSPRSVRSVTPQTPTRKSYPAGTPSSKSKVDQLRMSSQSSPLSPLRHEIAYESEDGEDLNLPPPPQFERMLPRDRNLDAIDQTHIGSPFVASTTNMSNVDSDGTPQSNGRTALDDPFQTEQAGFHGTSRGFSTNKPTSKTPFSKRVKWRIPQLDGAGGDTPPPKRRRLHEPDRASSHTSVVPFPHETRTRESHMEISSDNEHTPDPLVNVDTPVSRRAQSEPPSTGSPTPLPPGHGRRRTLGLRVPKYPSESDDEIQPPSPTEERKARLPAIRRQRSMVYVEIPMKRQRGAQSSGGVLNSEVSGKVSTSRSTSSNGDTAKRSTKQRSILDAEKVAKFQQFLVNHDISVRSLDKVSNLHPPDAAHRFLSAMNMVSPERNPDRMQEHTALHSWHGRPIADSPSTRHPTPAPTFDLHSDDKFGTPSKSRPLSDVSAERSAIHIEAPNPPIFLTSDVPTTPEGFTPSPDISMEIQSNPSQNESIVDSSSEVDARSAVPHSHSSQKASENSDDVLETPFASPFTTSANTLPTQQHAEPVVSNAAPGLYQFAFPPPSKDELRATMDLYGIPTVVYREPYFSDPKDVPARVRTFAGRNYKFEADDAQSLSEFDTSGCSVRANVTMTQGGSNKSLARGLEHWQETCRKSDDQRTRAPSSIRAWTVPFLPPLRAETVKWLKAHEAVKAEVKEQPGPLVLKESMRAFEKGIQERRKPVLVSQIEAPTPKNPYGFKYTQISTKNVSVQKQYMCSMSMELHATCRGDLLPDSQHDEIRALFYCLQHEDETRFRNNGTRPGYFVGIIMVQDEHPLAKTGVGGYAIDIVPDEKALLELLCQKVRFFDPDLLVGYDVHRASWGYAAERARDEHEFDLCAELSRVKPEDANTRFGRDEDAWGANKQSYMHTTGRIFLNVWRLMRSEMNLTSYTLESIAYHVLHIRVPKFTPKTLNEWYEKGMLFRWRTVKYYLSRVQYNLDLLDDTSMISRTSEFARVFGIDFFSVISRGSQYKVESIMARIVKPENFIMASPTKKQVAAQRACECLPLVMEPQSRFYNSPLLVLDFQSLYPSVMIAYNFCYSTCLGRVQNVGKPQKFGILDDYEVPAAFVEAFKDDLNVSPNGMVFVKPHIRESTLRRMLTEILDTRVMVKESMKLYKDDKSLQRILEARQLSLKFIANVTYGYTGASFSGRMPCVEIADAIVQTGRATLERAIDLIHQTKKWGAEVVYGDTDSLFVYLKGKSKDEAFVIGKDIVDTVTKMNPEPVKLKFEKVYHPCVLLAKKRYVGFKYESPDDVTPEFDAKGIETVRRDNCPAVGKSMEDCLKILFRTQDLSEVKRYLYRQWGKILSGRVSPQDFIIAKEVKYGTYSEHGREPPGADISRRKLKKDPRAEPEYGERVPYVVKYRGPGHLLVDCSVPPEELLNDRTARLHGEYYIRNLIIPSLARVFNLVGADVENWFDKMPKVQRAIQYTASQFRPDAPSNQQDDHKQNNLLGRTIDQYYTAKHCMVCHEMTYQELCTKCAKDAQSSLTTLSLRLNEAERRHMQLQRICRSCSAQNSVVDGTSVCVSLDCPVLFERAQANQKVRLAGKYLQSKAVAELSQD